MNLKVSLNPFGIDDGTASALHSPYLVNTLDGKPIYGLNRWTWKCLACDYVAVAMSVGEMDRAMTEHYAHVNTHAHKPTDPHFEDFRLDALISA